MLKQPHSEEVWHVLLRPQMYIAMISGHALALCGYQFITCVRVQWSGELYFLLTSVSVLFCRTLNLQYKHRFSFLWQWWMWNDGLDCCGWSRLWFMMLLCCCSVSECSDFSPPVTMMLMIFLCMEALLFLTFTAVMFSTQLHSICNDETVRTQTQLLFYQCECVCVTDSVADVICASESCIDPVVSVFLCQLKTWNYCV